MPANRIALILGIICALIASVLVLNFVRENENKIRKAQEIFKMDVVFAKEFIASRTIISAEQVEIRRIPKDGVPPNVATKLAEVIGLPVKTDIIAGEPINLNRLVRKGEEAGLSFLIPPGMRAITIAMDEVIGVAGFIRPGERVDVIGTIEPKNSQTGSITWTILQDIEVLAVSQELTTPKQDTKKTENTENKEKAKLGTSVTLAVTPYQAQKIALSEEKGVLRLTLRPALKEAEVKIAPIRENNLIPYGVDTGVRATGQPRSQPQTRRVEIISGNKVDYVTVY
jgi:pilus assembly protein CpaB